MTSLSADRFSALPGELRNKIYRNVWAGVAIKIDLVPVLHSTTPVFKIIARDFSLSQDPPALVANITVLTRVSRRIREEAAPLPFQLAAFVQFQTETTFKLFASNGPA